jgi:hypothetical protein
MSMPLMARAFVVRMGGFQAATPTELCTADHVEFWVRLLPEAAVTTVPELLVRCRDHVSPRNSDANATTRGAVELSALVHTHEEVLSVWPHELAELHCRAALRWAVAGNRDEARRHFRRSISVAPSVKSKAQVVRNFLPTYTKTVVRGR